MIGHVALCCRGRGWAAGVPPQTVGFLTVSPCGGRTGEQGPVASVHVKEGDPAPRARASVTLAATRTTGRPPFAAPSPAFASEFPWGRGSILVVSKMTNYCLLIDLLENVLLFKIVSIKCSIETVTWQGVGLCSVCFCGHSVGVSAHVF